MHKKRRAKAKLYQNKGYDIHLVRQALHIFSDSKRTEYPEHQADSRTGGQSDSRTVGQSDTLFLRNQHTVTLCCLHGIRHNTLLF
jgi:hypothetical protein